MTSEVTPFAIPVAFMFANNGQDWQGGINYFRSLFLALQANPESLVCPVVFLGSRADVAQYGLPESVQVRYSRVLDRMSLPWLMNRLSAKIFGRPLLINRLLRREGINVLSHGMPTGVSTIRNAAWIPDFQHRYLPSFFNEKELRQRDELFRSMIERSDLVIVSSEAARRDLQAFSPEHVGKARVLRFAAIPPAVAPDRRLDFAKLYGLTGRFFYIPNQAWAHKNHLTAIKALACLRDLPDVSIVCTGSLKDLRNPLHLNVLKSAINDHGLENRFRMLGMVPYEQIAELMLQSIAVINPSLFEGWSTTVEESKALGVPLILSDIPVHREQCEGLPARFFTPLDAQALAQAMRDAAAMECLSPEEAQCRLLDAQERHASRMLQFSRDYAELVRELCVRPG